MGQSNSLPESIIDMISLFLLSKNIVGLKMACQQTRKTTYITYDSYTLHICIGVDLTGSMSVTYRQLQIEIYNLLDKLKTKPIHNNKVPLTLLTSGFQWWDLEINPYVQIHTPTSAENVKSIFETASIRGGGGPECIGESLSLLVSEFKYKWVNKRMPGSLDIVILCFDAPPHYIADTESYYEVSKFNNIDIDWIKALNDLVDAGVLVIMLLIQNQPEFKQPLRLFGGFNTQLGGISIEIETAHLKTLPEFVFTIISTELQQRQIVHNIYLRLKKLNPKSSESDLQNMLLATIQTSTDTVLCYNINKSLFVAGDDKAKALSKCKNMTEAIERGLLEREDVTKALIINAYGAYERICYCSGKRHFQSPHSYTTSPHFTDTLDLDFTQTNTTDIAIQIPHLITRPQSCICYQSKTNYRNGNQTLFNNVIATSYQQQASPLLQYVDSSLYKAYIYEKMLKKDSPKQYELYKKGGLFSRSPPPKNTDNLINYCSILNPILNGVQTINSINNLDLPTMLRLVRSVSI